MVIQYERGVFGLLALARLISQQKKLNRHVFVMLHASGELATLTAETGLLEIRRALKSCDGIFVHSMLDVNNLDAFKVRKNVSYLPIPVRHTQLDEPPVDDQFDSTENYFLRKIVFTISRGAS